MERLCADNCSGQLLKEEGTLALVDGVLHRTVDGVRLQASQSFIGGRERPHRDTKEKEKRWGWAAGLCRTTRSDTGGKFKKNNNNSEVKVTQTWSLCLHRY